MRVATSQTKHSPCCRAASHLQHPFKPILGPSDRSSGIRRPADRPLKGQLVRRPLRAAPAFYTDVASSHHNDVCSAPSIDSVAHQALLPLHVMPQGSMPLQAEH